MTERLYCFGLAAMGLLVWSLIVLALAGQIVRYIVG